MLGCKNIVSVFDTILTDLSFITELLTFRSFSDMYVGPR